MKRQGMRFMGFGGVLLVCSMSAKADDASQQIQLLNSQIQAQLQQMQAAQQKQISTLNQQTQQQLKDLQTLLQNKMLASNKSTQEQIKTLQTTLQAQIQQVQAERAQSTPSVSSEEAKTPAAAEAPSPSPMSMPALHPIKKSSAP